ncbi:MAG TPA: ATP-binding protein, partial [Gammaproteobacteria bacterium]|nr:ATP-binding protein [Gammaproteobacteria bacterium]
FLAVSIAGVTFLLLGIAVIVSTYKESQNQQLIATAHQAGMAEVATSVLHNVGNILNSVNVSAHILNERLSKSKLNQLTQLNELLIEHKDDLAKFLSEDPRGKMLPEFINQLAKYNIEEREFLMKENAVLLKNIAHIKNVVGMQQNLSKKTKIVEQIAEIDKLLEEALAMTGIEENHPDIIVTKKYAFHKPVMIDSIKFLQILVNLLKNAKDSLQESSQLAKKLKLEIILNDQGHFIVLISDNGVGIAPDKMTKIFSYGFTTKKEGHGFGLHASALAAKDLGGKLMVKSDGLGKGATFILDMPVRDPEQ